MGVDGDEKAPQLPKAIPFTTFQSLEKDAGPEFMEIAIDYAEAMRNARDLTKLAKLTKQKVTVSSEEPGKPRMTMEIEYGAAEGSNLGSTKEYSSRAFQEAVGASIALNAAVEALPKKKQAAALVKPPRGACCWILFGSGGLVRVVSSRTCGCLVEIEERRRVTACTR